MFDNYFGLVIIFMSYLVSQSLRIYFVIALYITLKDQLGKFVQQQELWIAKE